ncbi:hypothetical protein QEN19_000268 [Hanseniaspora menglaensis]
MNTNKNAPHSPTENIIPLKLRHSRSSSFALVSNKLAKSLSKSSSFSSKGLYNYSFMNRSRSFSKKFNPFNKKTSNDEILSGISSLYLENSDFDFQFDFDLLKNHHSNADIDFGSPNTATTASTEFLITPKISNMSLGSSHGENMLGSNLVMNGDSEFNFSLENTNKDHIFSESDDMSSFASGCKNKAASAKKSLSIRKIPKEQIGAYIKELTFHGITLTKVSRKKKVKYTFKLVNNQLLNWKDKYVDLNQIKDIRVFEEGANYREQFNISKDLGTNWITIIYQVPTNKLKALHCYSSSNNQILRFYISMLYLVKKKHELVEKLALPNIEEFVDYHWKYSTINGLELLDVKKLCAKFNIFCSEKFLISLFQESDVNNDNRLDYFEFQTFVRLLKRRPDIEDIFFKFTSKESSTMSSDEFKNFLVSGQKITDEQEQNEILRVFDDYNNIKLLDFINFLESQPYLQSSDQYSDYYDYPLNHYFISSSHNTYLRGSQIGDVSTIESYIEVLQKGCRCVEVDVWDGEDGPVVSHGMLSSAISLKSVLEVIRKYAFITTSFPLIISFEVHCKAEYQYVMIYLIKEYFQGFLCQSFEESKMPSPNELKGKVIIKFTKRGKLYEDEEEDNDYSSDDELIGDIKLDGNITGSSKFNIAGKYKKKVDILPELLQIAAIQGIKYRNFKLPESKRTEHSFSLSERQLNEMKDNFLTRKFIDKHNRSFFMRTYPHFFRYKSTNFNNPLDYWELGVQMVATNWQTNDVGQCLNIAMFKQPISNEGTTQWNSGYVLKPDFMLSKVKVKDMEKFYDCLEKKLPILNFELDFISGHLINKPENWNIANNLYSTDIEIVLEYEIFTIKKNEAILIKSMELKNGFKLTTTKGQTKYFHDNGICPLWNAKLKFKSKYPEFTFLCLKVKTKEGSILGQTFLKILDLKPGYRCIPLSSNVTGDNFFFSKLFINFKYY